MSRWLPIFGTVWLGFCASQALAQQPRPPAGAHNQPAPAAGTRASAQPITAAAQPERDKQARLQFERGRRAFDEGDYRAAWGFFHEAYRLSGRAQLLYNIGQTADRLGHDPEALTAFRLYLERLPAADNRREVENRIRALQERIAEAERAPAPPGTRAAAAGPSLAVVFEPAAPPAPSAASPELPAADSAPAPPPSAASEARPTRRGFYLRVGLGAGIRRDGVSGGTEGTLSGVGFAGELALGGSPWPGFVVGGALYSDLASSPTFEGNNGAKAELGSAHLSMLGPMADWYVDPQANGFHLQAALTFAVVAIDYLNAGVTVGRDASGIGAILGAGYDWPVAHEWAVGVLGRLSVASLADDTRSHGVVAPSVLGTVTWY